MNEHEHLLGVFELVFIYLIWFHFDALLFLFFIYLPLPFTNNGRCVLFPWADVSIYALFISTDRFLIGFQFKSERNDHFDHHLEMFQYQFSTFACLKRQIKMKRDRHYCFCQLAFFFVHKYSSFEILYKA